LFLAWPGFYCRKAFGEERLPSWAGMPDVYYRDALFVGVGGVAALSGLQSALGWGSRALADGTPLSSGGVFSGPDERETAGGFANWRSDFSCVALLGDFCGDRGFRRRPPQTVRAALADFFCRRGDARWGLGQHRRLPGKIFRQLCLVRGHCYRSALDSKFNLLGIFLVVMGAALLPPGLCFSNRETPSTAETGRRFLQGS